MKKKIYKKWWFWLVIVFLFLGVIGISGSNTNENESSDNNKQIESKEEPKKEEVKKEEVKKEEVKEEKKDDGKIKAGSYKVGTDIAAGEYVVFSDTFTYVEVTKDSSGSFDSIVMNDNVTGHVIINVLEGQYVNLKGGYMYPFDKSPSLKPEDGIYKSGMYKVGVHIPAGEYKVTPDDNMAYLEVSKDSFNSFGSIITNDNISSEKYLTIEEGQYLKIVNATINTK